MSMRFLLATDLTPACARMLRYTFELNRSFFAQLELMHVFDIPVAAMDEEGILLRNHESVKHTFEQALWAFLEDNRGSYHFDTTVTVVSGGLYHSAADRARTWQADLIITAHHISNSVADLGGTGMGKRLLTHPPVPVLSIPDNASLPPDIKKILVCTDLTALPHEHDLQFLQKFIAHLNAKVSLLHVTVSDEISLRGDQTIIEAWKQALGTQLMMLENQKHEPPGKQIADYAETHEIDLLVVLPHRHNWLDHLLLGSETEKIFNSTSLPILSLRPAEK